MDIFDIKITGSGIVLEGALQGSHTPFGEWGRAHGIGIIRGVLTKIGKFDIVLMYDVSIARLIPIIKLTFFLDI